MEQPTALGHVYTPGIAAFGPVSPAARENVFFSGYGRARYKISVTAINPGTTPKTGRRNSARFRDSPELSVNNDRFIRTTDQIM
jgi:methionyl-tRNA synthetase